jgi:CDP-diacylglycerol--serine O-phosphatidyltransferase
MKKLKEARQSLAKLNLKINRAFIPGAFTTANIFCGFLSIVYAFDGNFVTASWLIVIAAILDALDGTVARLTHSYSKFGIELDSLSDVVSFGAAPSVLLYAVYFQDIRNVGVVISFLPLFFGAMRLARFNVNQDSFVKKEYSGLPIPSQAVVLASFIVFNYHFWGYLHLSKLLAPGVIFLGLLMISNVEYDTPPKFTFRVSKKNNRKLVLFILSSLTVMIFPAVAMFLLSTTFVFWGVLRSVLRSVRNADEVMDISDY